ncbi:glycosyltransferase family 2 protein [Sulfurimonas sp. HSL1-2]|uniref:glycosyltransferase family 2 protein n=1 Tax=Thiomicrolovo zhangzhouensis TaxID=3131933 RepID=UPI0031F7F7A9
MGDENIRPVISVVCPCYNEEDVINIFLREITKVLGEIGETYELVFINDGSRDNTLGALVSAKQTFQNMRIINLSRNFGKEAALTAGLDQAKGDVIIPIDVDLQDPPEMIKEFMLHWRNGSDVVLARRIDRSSDSFAKRVSARLFYKFNNKISKVAIPENVGDYRLMTRKVLDALQQLPESERFMKGLFAWVGFKATVVDYKRDERKAGKTSFNGWKLWNFALEGITSFSTFPLKVWLYLGLIISLLAFFYGTVIILQTIILGVDMPGYASTMTTILFLGGIQLIGIGVLGEYIGRIYMESKRRPTYIIEDEY